MKTILSITTIAALAFSGSLSAQTAYSKPSGYTTQSLPANRTTMTGINLQNPAVIKGTFTSISGRSLSDTNVNFTTLLTTGKTYIIEIDSGTSAGGVEWFTSWSGSTLTVASNLNSPSTAVGNTYTIRLAPTLDQLFPENSLTTFALVNATSADKVWVQQADKTFLKYARKTGINAGWHLTNGSSSLGLVTVDIPIVTTDGLIVEKKAVSGNFTVSGEVKTTPTSNYITRGTNLVTINPPTGLTLFTSGLEDDLVPFGLTNTSSADKIWIPQSDGSLIRYALKTGTNAGWYVTSTNNAAGARVIQDIPLPSALYIQLISATPKRVSFSVPSAYQSL